MDEAKLNLLIKKSIVPRASLSSLVMCVSSVGKTDKNAACLFLKALCDQDIYKAASITKHLSGVLGEDCHAVVYSALRQHIDLHDALSEEDLLAILEYQNLELFQAAIPFISKQVISQAFLRCTSQDACRLMAMILRCADDNLIDYSLGEFSVFLNRYDSSGDLELAELLPMLLECNAVHPVSRLIELLGISKLESLYGTGLFEEVDRMIVSGFDSLALWETYFYYFFKIPRSNEELLLQGVWYIQLYASTENENIAAAFFYLYAVQHLGVNHQIFDYTVCFARPSYFSRDYTARYLEILQPHWNNPDLLAQFLDKTAICNPFEGKLQQDNNFPLIRDSQNFQNYDRLVTFFEKKVSCETILYLFFHTNLRHHLPLEDLLYLSRRYGILDSMLVALRKIQFDGLVTNHKKGRLILAPNSYYVMSLHCMQLEYHTLESRNNIVKRWKGKKLPYIITNYENGQILVNAFLEETEMLNTHEDTTTWDCVLDSFESILSSGTEQEYLKHRKIELLDFSVDSFVNENDFGLLTNLYTRFPDRIDSLLVIMSRAKWNASFLTDDLHIPSRFYWDFGKYQDQSILMFRAFFAQSDIPCQKILNLYFSSVYKVIVPLDRLLEIADREIMLDALRRQDIPIRLREEGKSLCRPVNIACSPVCRVENFEGLKLRETYPAVITDFTVVGGIVSRIILKSRHAQPLSTHRERGALFGYLAQNELISKPKLAEIARMPSIDTYDARELLFGLNCIEKAIILRRSSGDSLMQLLNAMGDKNPYAFQASIQADIIYLGNLYSEKKKQTLSNAFVSMILNAADINAIEEVYKNTGVKYCLHMDKLVTLITSRRPNLADGLSAMFKTTQFQCTADSDGWLWSPFVAQGTIKVGSQYAGLCLTCNLHIEADGAITAQILSAKPSPDTLHPFILCLMTGYCTTQAMVPHLSACLIENDLADTDDTAQSILQDREAFDHMVLKLIGKQRFVRSKDTRAIGAFQKQVQVLQQMLQEENFNHKAFTKQTNSMVQACCRIVPMQHMEHALSVLSENLILRCQDTECVLRFMRKVFVPYSYGYRDNGLVHIWISQLAKYFGNDAAERFSGDIQSNKRYLLNK